MEFMPLNKISVEDQTSTRKSSINHYVENCCNKSCLLKTVSLCDDDLPLPPY